MSPNDPNPFAFLNAEWALRELPVITYYCRSDERYTMRWINAGGGNILGYDMQSFVENRNYFALSAVHPEDVDLVDDLADCAASRATPGLARLRLVHQDGQVIPVLLASRAIRDESGAVAGFCGMVLNIGPWADLRGPSRVLTEPGAGGDLPRVEIPAEITPDWVAARAPTAVFVSRDDESHTLYFAAGAGKELSGYEPADFVLSAKYRAVWTLHPDDVENMDQLAESAIAARGQAVAARMRVVHEIGRPIPVLIAARSVQHAGMHLTAGAVYDLSGAPALQGPPMVFEA